MPMVEMEKAILAQEATNHQVAAGMGQGVVEQAAQSIFW